MVNREKIITMTKLAIYDKRDGASDRAANEFFRHDYIYKKNIGTRIAVGIGGVILLALYWLGVVFVDGVDVFELDLLTHIMESMLIVVAIIAAYSVIGTIHGTREYYLVQKRLKKYHNLVNFLEAIDGKGQKAEEISEKVEEKEAAKQDSQNEIRPALRPEARPEPRPEPRSETRSEARTETPDRRESLLEARERRERERREREQEREREREAREARAEAHNARTEIRETRADSDPLANVSARAMSGSRPRSNIRTRRDESRPRYTLKPGPTPRDN